MIKEKLHFWNKTLQADDYREAFHQKGVTVIPNFLPAKSADLLHQCMEESKNWSLVFLERARAISIPMDRLKSLTLAEQASLDQRIDIGKQMGFQFRFFRHSDGERDAFSAILEQLRGQDFTNVFLSFARTLTGDQELCRVNVQASCYSKKCFLSKHDDRHPLENRRFAYVLHLAPSWEKEWGGNLEFLDTASGEVLQSIVPGFNALTLFEVPKLHRVGLIEEEVPGKRFAIHGWFSARKSDGVGA